jgi:hypothetical protein
MYQKGVKMEEKQTKSLVSLVDELAWLEMALIESGGEITKEIEDACPEFVTGAVAQKVDNYANYIDKLEYNVDFYKAKAQNFLKIAAGLENFKKHLEDNIQFAMLKNQTTELLGIDYKYKLMKSQQTVILNENIIPSEFQNVKTSVSIDKKRIKEAIESGRDIPGAVLSVNTHIRKYNNSKK